VDVSIYRISPIRIIIRNLKNVAAQKQIEEKQMEFGEKEKITS